MSETQFYESAEIGEASVDVFRNLLGDLNHPFVKGDSVGIKLHWGEKGNRSYLPPYSPEKWRFGYWKWG